MQRRISALWISIAMLMVAAPALAQEEGDTGTADVSAETNLETTAIAEPVEEGADNSEVADARPISVALLLGYGLDLGGTGTINPFGLGFGVRGGYNFDEIYIGGRFMFFLGGSEDFPGGSVSFNVMTIGVEGGYDFDVSGITIRPELGLGLALSSSETPTVVGTVDSSSTDLYIAPGVSVLGCITDSIFVGGNLSIPIIFAGSGYQGLEILATAGMRF